MKQKYRLFRRSTGIFFIEDRLSGKQESLLTRDKEEAQRLLHARNEAHQQPLLNLQIARAYLAASDPEIHKRTWQHVLQEIVKTKSGETQERWRRAAEDKAFNGIRHQVVLGTTAEQLLRALDAGSVSTNVYLRHLHNFALDMSWLPWPIIPKRQWPKTNFRHKRAITFEEHLRIISLEWDAERKAFYQLCWHLGGSQSDVATLKAEDIDWPARVICFFRKKTRTPVRIQFGEETAAILKTLPQINSLFPRISQMHEKHRAAEFKRRCVRLKIEGISLHSYRFAWAERAKQCGYPERFAQEALGHASTAVHRAYARNAAMKLPALEDYEKAMATKIVSLAGIGSCATAQG